MLLTLSVVLRAVPLSRSIIDRVVVLFSHVDEVIDLCFEGKIWRLCSPYFREWVRAGVEMDWDLV